MAKRADKAELVTISAKLARACSFFCSTEEVRYYLTGVYFAPHPKGGVIAVGTDGHRLIAAHDASGKCSKPCIVKFDRETWAPLKKDRSVDLVIDAAGIVRCEHYAGTKSALIDGVYPEWHQVAAEVHKLLTKRFYSKPVYGPAAFNATYLSEFAKVNAALKENGSRAALKIVSFSERDPALILFPDEPRIFALLMPMRASGDCALPAFMQPILQPPAPNKSAAPAAARAKARQQKRKAA